MSEKHILLADPDARTAEELRQALGQGWIVNSVETAAAALRELRAQAYDGLIVSLHLTDMPPKQLLNRVRTKFPNLIRFVVASEQDRELVVNESLGAHQILIRPFDADGLRTTIAGALGTERWLESEQLRKLVARMRSLPTVPALYLDIIAALRSPTATTEDVGQLIVQDMAITTKLLQVINSAYFGLPRTVTSPAEAVALLGFETAKSMVMAVKLLNQYDRIKIDGFSIDSLWQHSTAVANSARQLVLLQTGERSLAESAFAMGLLHDVGKAVLAGNFGEQYGGADSLARKQRLPLCEVEKEIFGAHHGEVGAYLLSLWGLPRNLLEAAAFHHHPSRSADQTFTVLTAVHVANALQYIANPDVLGHVAPELDLAYLESIGMSECLPSWCEELLGEEAASRYLAPKQASANSKVPQPELAFTPPPASAVCPDPVVPQPLPDKPASEMTPEELCTVEAAADVEVSKNEMSEAENEVNAQESFTSDPADITAAETAPMGATPVETAPTDRTPAVTTLPQEAPQPVISGGRRNRWLVTAGLSVFGLLVICLVLGRSGRDHQHAVPVQAREPQPAQAEPAAASAPADQNALTDAKDSTPGLDSAVSSNSVASSAPDASSSVKAGPEVVAEPAPTKPAFPALKLQGILFSPQHPSAIINGALVRRNDRLDGARIVEIRQTTVTVEFQKERRVLSLE